jgi:dihydropteroate synthase
MHIWRVRDRVLEIGRRPLVVGILNVTPDSFSDGGEFCDLDAAIERGLKLIAEGADILDIGGESTRPGAPPVTEADELARVVPVIEALADETDVPLSVDTMKTAVAAACLKAGAAIINDVSGFRDPAMIQAAVKHGAGAIVMHMQGTPATMQTNPKYDDVAFEVGEFFSERIATLTAAGLPAENICLDPGIGFGKTLDHNLELLGELGSFQRLGRPVCLGVSRKGFIGTICKRDVNERLAGSLAVACFAADRGEAQLLRVHDVAATRDAMLMLERIPRTGGS